MPRLAAAPCSRTPHASSSLVSSRASLLRTPPPASPDDAFAARTNDVSLPTSLFHRRITAEARAGDDGGAAQLSDRSMASLAPGASPPDVHATQQALSVTQRDVNVTQLHAALAVVTSALRARGAAGASLAQTLHTTLLSCDDPSSPPPPSPPSSASATTRPHRPSSAHGSLSPQLAQARARSALRPGVRVLAD